MQQKLQTTAKTHFQQAYYFFNKSNFEAALQQANAAIHLDPNYADARCIRGSCYRDQGELNKAVAEYLEAIKLQPNYPWTYYNLALAYEKLGNHQQQINNLDRFLKFHPDNVTALTQKGCAYLSLKNYSQSIVDLERARQLDPKIHGIYHYLAIAHLNLNQFQKAFENINEAIKLLPNNQTFLALQKQIKDKSSARYHFQQACDFFNKNNFQAALQYANEAIRLDPNYAEARCVRGSCYRELGELNKAVSECNEAITLQPNYAWSYYNLALAYEKLGNHQQKINNLDRFLVFHPDNATALTLRNKANGVTNMRKKIDLTPLTQKKQTQLQYSTYYQQWYQNYQKKDFKAAYEAICRCIALDPKNANAYCQRGHTLAYLGRRVEAVQDYNYAFSVSSEAQKVATHYECVVGFGILGDRPVVFKHIQAILKLNKAYAQGAAFMQLGHYYSHEHNYQAAANAFKEYLKFSRLDAARKQLVATAEKNLKDSQVQWLTAASTGNLQIIQKMVAVYFPGFINILHNGHNALHAASSIGNVALMQYLITQGINLHAIASNGYNAMDYAIHSQNLAAVKLLSPKGLKANKFATGDYVPFFDLTVIPRITFADGEDYFYYGGGSSFNGLVTGLEALNMSNCNLSQAQTALQDINSYVNSLNAWVADHLAKYGDFRDYAKPIQAYCAAKKAQIEKRIAVLSNKGTVQHHVASKGSTQILEHWVEQGVGLAITDSLGNTPLHLSAANGHLACIKVLIEKATPAKNYCDPSRRVLTKKELINKPNQDGLTPLHCAAAHGHVPVMQYLMRHGADVHAKSKAGLNALDYAARYKKASALDWLKNIHEITFATDRISVAKSHEHNNEWLIMASSAQSALAFSVRVGQQNDALKESKDDRDDIVVLVTEQAIQETMKQLDYVPLGERKPAAVALLGTTSLSHFQESLANPEKQIANCGIKDQASLGLVKENIAKSDIKIVYPGLLAAKTGRTEWGLAMMTCDHEKAHPANQITSFVRPHLKSPDELFPNHAYCAEFAAKTITIGSGIISLTALGLGAVAVGAGLETGGVGLFALHAIGSFSVMAIARLQMSTYTIQNKCEEFLHVPKEKQTFRNYAYDFGKPVHFSSAPFFGLSKSIQNMPIFDPYVRTVTTFQSTAPTSLHCNLPATTLPVLKTGGAQTLPSSTGTVLAKLSPHPAPSLQANKLQVATLEKEKQQTQLYYKQQQFTVKQALSQAAVIMTKSPANYGSIASHSVLSSSNNGSPNRSPVMSSGGEVTTGQGGAVTTSNSPDYGASSDRRGVAGDYSRR